MGQKNFLKIDGKINMGIKVPKKTKEMSKDSISIRPYNPADKAALLRLMDLNTPDYFAVSEKDDFQNYLEQEIELYFVITSQNQIVGCGGINCENEKTIGIISWDIIHPDFQGKGFGKKLLQHRISKLKLIPLVQKIIVRTSQSTFKFYQKQGFELLEIIPDYWAEGFDLYAMEYVYLQ